MDEHDKLIREIEAIDTLSTAKYQVLAKTDPRQLLAIRAQILGRLSQLLGSSNPTEPLTKPTKL